MAFSQDRPGSCHLLIQYVNIGHQSKVVTLAHIFDHPIVRTRRLGKGTYKLGKTTGNRQCHVDLYAVDVGPDGTEQNLRL